MKTSSFVILLFLFNYATSQTTADFEDFNLEIDTFLNGSDGSGGFASGNIFLPNSFQDFGVFTTWNGWAISTKTDITTPGFTNEFSCISGSGVNGSKTYATSYTIGENKIHLNEQARGKALNGFYINNSTYAYYSMLEGDSFAKKFGGETGDDPDFLYVTFKKYFNGKISSDSLNVFLADFRFEDNSQDYIVDKWTFVDLSNFNNVDSISIVFHSSDINSFGITTPTYFCMDNFTTADMVTLSQDEPILETLNVFPNPAQSVLYLNGNFRDILSIDIYNQHGQRVGSMDGKSIRNQIDISFFPQGIYQMVLTSASRENITNNRTITFIKN